MIEFGKGSDYRQVGSASIIYGENGPIVATAAHCVYDFSKKDYYEEIHFIAINDDGRKYSPIAVAIPKAFVEHTYLEFDTCFLIMEDEFTNNEKFAQNALQVGFNMPKELEYSLWGYNGDENMPVNVCGRAISDQYKNTTLQGVMCKTTQMDGLSGGPWITEIDGVKIQNSISILSYNSVKDIMWGPYWGKCIKNAYEVANNKIVNKKDIEFHVF